MVFPIPLRIKLIAPLTLYQADPKSAITTSQLLLSTEEGIVVVEGKGFAMAGSEQTRRVSCFVLSPVHSYAWISIHVCIKIQLCFSSIFHEEETGVGKSAGSP